MCTVCVALSCCLSADICAPNLMTSLFNTILKVLAPVTVSHQTYIVSNVSLKKKNRKILTDTPPPPPHVKCPIHSDPLVSGGCDQA